MLSMMMNVMSNITCSYLTTTCDEPYFTTLLSVVCINNKTKQKLTFICMVYTLVATKIMNMDIPDWWAHNDVDNEWWEWV